MASGGRGNRRNRIGGAAGGSNGGDGAAARDLVPSERSLLDLMGRTHKVRGEGGREEEITTFEAVQRKAVQSAMNGSVHAQRDLLDRHQQAEAQEQARRRDKAIFWRTFRDGQRQRLASWLREGRGEDDFFPHPDDIAIEPDDQVRFLGPFDEEELAKVRQTMAMREAFLWQAKYEDRPGVLSDEAWDEGGTSGRLMSWMFNMGLPPRLRWDEPTFYRHSWMVRQWRTRREAARAVQQKWRSIGVDLPRGTTFLPFNRMRRFLLGLTSLTGRYLRDGRAGREWKSEQLQQELAPMLASLHAKDPGEGSGS